MDLNEILSCYKDNETEWDNLTKLYAAKSIAPFIGAGMSAPVYPIWSVALDNILDGTSEERKELDHLLKAGQYEEAGEYVRTTVGENMFNARVKTEFSMNKLPARESNNIKKTVNSGHLKDCFTGPVFTTNFDRMLEHCYDGDFLDTYYLSNMQKSWAVVYDAIRNKTHNLYKIHGDVLDPNSWVFSKEQYEEAYGRSEFVTAIDTFFRNMNFLFMGCSLTEGDRFVLVLKHVVEELKRERIEVHNIAFLELPDKGTKTEEEYHDELVKRVRFLGTIGVYPIWYPHKKHEAIPVLLNALIKKNSLQAFNIDRDRTTKATHFYLFSSDIHIQHAFVDNCFESYKYDHNNDCTEAKPVSINEILKIIEDHDAVFIEGAYGSGKTVLSTKIQFELMNKGCNTLFFNVDDFLKEPQLYKSLKDINEKCYIFIDGIDKLVDEEMNTELLESFCEEIDDIYERKDNLSFIFNSREYYEIIINTEKKHQRFSFFFSIALNKELFVVKTLGFKDAFQYEKFFSNIRPKNIKSRELKAKTIKQWHKKSPLSCHIPLFAYVIGTYYYNHNSVSSEEENVLPENRMIIYEDFVERTIKGRFQEESPRGTINTNLLKIYDDLLKKISIGMIHDMRKNIDYHEDVSGEAQELSKNEIYAMKLDKFDGHIQKKLIDIMECKEDGVVLSDVINNYFFTIYPNKSGEWMVRFSDLNVMCCFAASYIYDKIIKFLHGYEDSEEIISALNLVELQPQVMDFLICKIKALSKEERDNLLNNILICLTDYNNNVISKDNVNALLVLYIIFIKFYDKSYKYVNTQNLIKAFYRACMAAKAFSINGEYEIGKERFLAERYFMECAFIGCQFRRMNYKHYNFSKSRIIDSDLYQCKLAENEFVNTILKNTSFQLCSVKTPIKNALLEDTITFSICQVEGVDFIQTSIYEKEGKVVFNNCTIQKLVLNGIKEKGLTFEFNKCIMADIKIIDCKGIIVTVNDCIQTGKIFLIGSTIYSDDDECFDNKVKALEFFSNEAV